MWPDKKGILRKDNQCLAAASVIPAPKPIATPAKTSSGTTGTEDSYAQFVLGQFSKATTMTQAKPTEMPPVPDHPILSPSRNRLTMTGTWSDLDFWKSHEWETIQKRLYEEGKACEVSPPRSLVLRPLIETPLDKVKVVILAAEPYSKKGTPDGLAYSVSDVIETVEDLPQVLQNIIIEAQNDVGIQEPRHGSLRSWARQGVLLWNASLTVRKEFPMSHETMGWATLTKEVIETVYLANPDAVFVFWDNRVRHYSVYLPTQSNRIITAGPSVQDAYRGFFKSRPFTKINEILTETNQKVIDWNIK